MLHEHGRGRGRGPRREVARVLRVAVAEELVEEATFGGLGQVRRQGRATAVEEGHAMTRSEGGAKPVPWTRTGVELCPRMLFLMLKKFVYNEAQQCVAPDFRIRVPRVLEFGGEHYE